MKIKEIILYNYKQYYGKQKITFAGYNSGQNVTVIYGENGRGKTSLYRALMYALYGDKSLDQDRGYGRNEEEIDSRLYTVNTNALEEDFNANHEGIKCFVEVTFKHNSKEYTLYREMFGIQNDPT